VRIYGGSRGHYYENGFAWALARLAEGVPAEELTYAAYYGPQRAAEMEAWEAECRRREAERRSPP